MWQYLYQHPEIFMSRVKEPHYFSRNEPTVVTPVKDEQSYLRLFSGSSSYRLRGEASPSYLRDSETPARVRHRSPGAKIVIILRDPVARAESAYWHAVRYGLEERTLQEAIEAALAERSPTAGRYLQSGFYAEAVERWLETFPDSVLILLFDELVADIRSEMESVFRFLEVDSTFAERLDTGARNRSSLPRNSLVARLYRSRAVRELGGRLVPLSAQPSLERALLSRPAQRKLGPDLRREVGARFAADVERLERTLGRPLPWGG